MRCSICHRRLLRLAVPGLQIGPKCARDRGLLPEPVRRVRIFSTTAVRSPDVHQVDWIHLINAGWAGERAST